MSRGFTSPIRLIDPDFLREVMGHDRKYGRVLIDAVKADEYSPNHRYNLIAASLAEDPDLDIASSSFDAGLARRKVREKIAEADDFVFNPETANQDKRDISFIYSYLINVGSREDNRVSHRLAAAIKSIQATDPQYYPDPHYQNYILRNAEVVGAGETSRGPVFSEDDAEKSTKEELCEMMLQKVIISPYRAVRTNYRAQEAGSATSSMVQNSFGGSLNQEKLFIEVHLAIEHQFTLIRNNMYGLLSGTLNREEAIGSLRSILEEVREVRSLANLLNIGLNKEFFGELMRSALRGSEQYKKGEKAGVVDEETGEVVSDKQGGTVAQSMMLRELDAFCGIVHSGRVARLYEHQAINLGEKERNTLVIVESLSEPMRAEIAKDPEATKLFAGIIGEFHAHRMSHRRMVERFIGKYVAGVGGTENPLTFLDEVNADTFAQLMEWRSKIPATSATRAESEALKKEATKAAVKM